MLVLGRGQKDDKHLLSYEEAVSLLPSSEVISGVEYLDRITGVAFQMSSGATKRRLREAKSIELSGPNMKGVKGLGIGIIEQDDKWVFIEHDPEAMALYDAKLEEDSTQSTEPVVKHPQILDKSYLHTMYNATCTGDGSGELETYEAWLERQLLHRINGENQAKAHYEEKIKHNR